MFAVGVERARSVSYRGPEAILIHRRASFKCGTLAETPAKQC